MAELVSLITNRIATYSTQKTASKDAEAKSVKTDAVKLEESDADIREIEDRADETKERIKDAVKKGNESGIMANSRLSYSIDERTDTIVVQVVDKQSGEVIRQIPPSEFLNIAARLEEQKGAIVNEEG